ncbi:MAG: DUF4956 domain-containing protein [Candidatus Woesearchaeota archaeon]
MVWYINSLESIGSATNVFSVVDIINVLVISTVLCYIAAKTYQLTHEGLSYSSDFVQTILVFGVLVSTIMLIIGSNIARAFTLVGALSIIRFRNPVKETRDVGYIFFMMTIGMAVGTRFYVLAVIMTLFVCFLFVLMRKTKFASKKHYKDEILKVVFPKTLVFEDLFDKLLEKYLDHHDLLSIETTDNDQYNEAVVLVRFKKGKEADRTKLINELKKTKHVKSAYLIGTEHLTY